MAPLTKISMAMLALGSTAVADLTPIVAKGSKLFYQNGTEFFIKGVAYQQDAAQAGKGTIGGNDTKYTDPLADESACKRDVPLLKELGTNTIRTYAIDPTANHDACMELLQDAGIYVISDLSEPALSIDRDDPQWNVDLYQRYTDVIDNLSKYPNVIGFFAGNEVSNNNTNTDASAFVKAAVRDSKKYIKDNVNRWMGVGYAANDDADIRDDIAHYFNCGEQDDAIDFWGYNIYSWCGNSNLEDSGYQTQADFFKDFSVPVFFAEYGCNNNGAANRQFTETAALYGDVMAPVFAGGIVYMYFQEANDYGLVKVDGGDATKLKDFNALKNQVAKADPKGVDSDDYSPTAKPAQCPDVSKAWAASDSLPPTPDKALCDCMVSAASCVPSKGLDEKDYGDIFGNICGLEDGKYCAGFKRDTKTGIYGAYSMCNPTAQLANALDTYYKDQNSDSTACDFEGQATIQKSSAASSCDKSLAAASSVNAQVATATAAVSGTSSGSDDDSDDSDDADSFGVQNVAVGLYSLVGVAVGAGFMML